MLFLTCILTLALGGDPAATQGGGPRTGTPSIRRDDSPAARADATARRWLARAYLGGEVAEKLQAHPLGNGHGRALDHLEQVLVALQGWLDPETSSNLGLERGLEVLASVERLLERHQLIEADWEDRSRHGARPDPFGVLEPLGSLEQTAIRLCADLDQRLGGSERSPGGREHAGRRSLAQYEAQWRLRRYVTGERAPRPGTRTSLESEVGEALSVAELLRRVDDLRLGGDMDAEERMQLEELSEELSTWTGDLLGRLFPSTGTSEDEGGSVESWDWRLDALESLMATAPLGASSTLSAHLSAELEHMSTSEGDHARAFAQWTRRLAEMRRITEVENDPAFRYSFGPGASGLEPIRFRVVPSEEFPWTHERGINELVRRGEPLDLELHGLDGASLASARAEIRILDGQGTSHALEGYWSEAPADALEPLLLAGYDYIVEYPGALQPLDDGAEPLDLRIVVADWPPETLPLELPSRLLPGVLWVSRKRTFHDSSTGDREWFGMPERPWTRLHAGHRMNTVAGVAPRPLSGNLHARAYLELLNILGSTEPEASSVPKSENKRRKALEALDDPHEPYAVVDLRAEALRDLLNDYQFPTHLPEGEFAAWIEGFAADSLGWDDLRGHRLLANPGDIDPGVPYVVRESLRLTGGR